MFRIRQSIFFVVFVLAGSAATFSQPPASDATERRIDTLLKQMTLQEKVGQLAQYTSNTPQNLELVRQGKVGSLFNVLGASEVNARSRA